MENRAFIALGSNMGDRFQYLEGAARHLEKSYPIEVIQTSSIYETDPVGYENQDAFLNMVMEIRTSFSPEQLLEACLSTETELGRERQIRWGPRTIDLDILLYNMVNIETENLVIPHPRMHERAFVLVPLVEICPDSMLFTAEMPDKEGMRMWKERDGKSVFNSREVFVQHN